MTRPSGWARGWRVPAYTRAAPLLRASPASARPMPRLAPVTSTALPAMVMSVPRRCAAPLMTGEARAVVRDQDRGRLARAGWHGEVAADGGPVRAVFDIPGGNRHRSSFPCSSAPLAGRLG